MKPTPPCPPTTDHFRVGLLLIVALASALRSWQIENPSFDYDEVYELVHRTTDLSVLISRYDGFPPLYRWLVAWVMELTGSDQSARWFSAVFGVATVAVVGWLGKIIAGPRVGLMAALLLAFSANHVQISQHARGYSLYLFFASLIMLTAWRLRTSDLWRDWFYFLIASWLGVATHYFAGLLIALLGGMLLIEKRGTARGRAALAAIAFTLACLPLLVCLRADMQPTDDFNNYIGFDLESYAFTYLRLVSAEAWGPSLFELREMPPKARLAAIVPWALLLGTIILTLAFSAWKRLNAPNRAWFLVLLLSPPPLMALASGAIHTGYHYRYLDWMTLALMLCLAAGATFDRRRLFATLATLGLLGISLLAICNRHFDPRYSRQDFHAAVARISQENSGNAQTPAVLTAPLYFGEAALYALPKDWVGVLVPVNPNTEENWNAPLNDFYGSLGERTEYWVLTPWYRSDDPRHRRLEELLVRIEAKKVERISPGVMLYYANRAGFP